MTMKLPVTVRVELEMSRVEYEEFKKMAFVMEKNIGKYLDLSEALHYMIFDKE